MPVRAVLLAGVAFLVVGVFAVLFHSEGRQAGSNHVPEVEEVVKRRGDWRRCQNDEIVPRGARKLRLLVGTYGRPTPKLSLTARTAQGDVVTAGTLAEGNLEGHVDIPLGTVGATRGGVRVCLSVTGPGRTVLYGAGEKVRFDWFRDGSESWLAMVPAIGHRFGLGKANPVGGLLLAVAGGLLFVSWVMAIRLVLREVGQ